jgi:hypothetical protein
MITRTFGALLVAAGIAAAQQGATEDEIRKQAAEVSRLMRESERLLLEITRVDRLVESQKQVEEELKKLLPPEQGGEGALGAEEAAQKRQQLETKHQELAKRIEEMLAGEKEKANLTVQQLEELLKQLPRQQQQGGGGQGDPKSGEREKRLKDREEEERKQHQPQQQQQQKPRDPKDPQKRTEKRPPAEDPAASRRDRVQAWIAKLPPEEQERINRNDFTRIPLRYRRLVEEYTAQRAKRAAEKESTTDR